MQGQTLSQAKSAGLWSSLKAIEEDSLHTVQIFFRSVVQSTANTIAAANEPGVDVLHFRIATTLSPLAKKEEKEKEVTPEYNQKIALTHIRNVLLDALNRRGLFANRTYDEVSFCGYSYGAGVARLLTTPEEKNTQDVDLAGVQAALRPVLGDTVFVDGIEFCSTPPTPITRRPPSKHHVHVYLEEYRGSFDFASPKGNPIKPSPDISNTKEYSINPRVLSPLTPDVARAFEKDGYKAAGLTAHHRVGNASDRNLQIYKLLGPFLSGNTKLLFPQQR